MGEYANVKLRTMKKLLKWLSQNRGVEIQEGSKHTKVKVIHNSIIFTIPRHGIVNKHIVKSFQKFLSENDICTKEEFDQKI